MSVLVLSSLRLIMSLTFFYNIFYLHSNSSYVHGFFELFAFVFGMKIWFFFMNACKKTLKYEFGRDID
jgi:hypothetical protein